jgi:hypothetical protein
MFGKSTTLPTHPRSLPHRPFRTFMSLSPSPNRVDAVRPSIGSMVDVLIDGLIKGPWLL